MIAIGLTEIVTISKHLNVKNIKTYISKNSIEDLKREDTPEPKPVDGRNRSSQKFCMQVVATRNASSRTILAQGQDIYAVSAPLVVEVVKQVLGSETARGVATLGQAFNAPDFLKSLSPFDIVISRIETV